MRIILPRLITPRHVLANIGRECILLAYVVILICMANMVNANVVIKNHSSDYHENTCEVSDLNGSHAGPYAETNFAFLPEPLSMAMPSAAPAPASAAAGTDPFVLVYNVAAGNTITLPTNGTVNISVDWGDGSTNSYSTFGNRTHTYSTAGEYTVKITGTLTKFGNIGFTQEKLIRVTSFGDIGLIHVLYAFKGAINLTQAPATLPATVTNLSGLFYGCTSFNQDISGWDVSNVSNMSSVFYGCKAFNKPLNTWNVSNVTIMGFMFATAENFNQPLNSWDVSKVKDMGYMFSGAKAFNQPLNGWNVSLVQSMGSMFTDCLNFNQDLSGWNMINVENFLGFLSGATLSTDNYDKLLVNLATGWRASITFSGGNSKYSQVGEVARTKLRTQKGWSITDGGPLPKLTVSSPTITATKAYDGTTSATVTPGTLSGMADGDVVTVSAEATYADANVGTGKTITVVYTLAGPASAKYNKPDNYTVTNCVITALPLSITDPTLPTTTKVYDGTPSATVTAGTLSGMLSGDDVIVSAAATYADANVGTGKTITVAYTLSGAASGNYTKPVDYTVTNGEITAKPLTVANPTLTTSKPYDGNTSVVVSAGTLSGVATGDGVTVSATGTYDTPSLGSGKTITVSYTLNGAKSGNYIKPADYQVTTGTISAKPLTITNPTLTTSKGYDGTPSATVTPGTLSGAVTGEGITVSAVATYANANTGTGKTITVVYTLGGATSGNYTKPADYTVNTGVITVKPLTIAAPVLTTSKVYDGLTSATVTPGTLSGVVTGEDVTVLAAANYADAKAGTSKTITVVYTLGGSASGNYTKPANYTTTSGVITAKPLSITDPTLTTTKVYDGTPSTSVAVGTLSGKVGSDVVSATASATYDNANAGTGKTITVAFSIAGTASGNYTKPANYVVNNGEITAKPLSAPYTDLTTSKSYDGSTSAVVLPGGISGVITGDGVTVSATATYDTPSPGSGKTIAVSYTLNGAKSGNYIKPADYAVSSGAITAKSLTISGVTAASKVYDGSVTAVLSGGTLNDVVGSEVVTITSGTGTFADKNAGSGIAVTAADYSLSGTDAGNYTLSAQPSGLTAGITKATLTATADDRTKVYGAVNPELTFKYSGWVNGEETIDTPPTIGTTVDATAAVGTYPGAITLSGGSDNNYEFAFLPADLEITQATLFVTPDMQIKTYGAVNPELTFKYDGWVNGEEPIDISPTIFTSISTSTTVGTYPSAITLSGGADNNYDLILGPGGFIVRKAPLTVTADAQTKVYGAANPELTFKYSGWKNDENETVLDVQPTASTTVGATTAAGTYPGAITLSGGSDNNYEFAFVPADLEITKATLFVTPDMQIKTYGAVNPELTFKYDGWVNGEEPIDISPTISTSISTSTTVGTYPSAITLSGGADNNYDLILGPGGFIIRKAPLTVTAVAQTKVYGAANPELTFKYSGWKNDENETVLDVQPTASTTVGAATAVGTYSEFISVSGGSDNNYDFVFVPANLEIAKATLTATADARTKVYGAANPELTFKYSGWVNGEEPIDAPPTIGTTADATTAVGTYPGVITLSGGSDNNYDFVFVPANLEITKATLTATADDRSEVYGAVNPELTFKYSGWVNGEEPIDTPPTIGATADAATAVGTYPGAITLSGGSDNNYMFNYVPGALEVTKAPLTVTADTQTKVYGAANPELTFKYSGWVNGEETIDTPPTIGTTVDATTAAGTYPGAITLSGGSDNNYEFAFVPANLEITKATLTATADDRTKVYGAANPELTFKYNGWVNGEETIDTPPTIGTTADATAAVGTYPGAITLSGGSDNNYDFVFVPANLEITKATLTATADDRTKVYGAANPELTFKYSGWVNGEEPIDAPPTIGTTADATAAVGTYPGAITLSGGSDNNYEFAFVPANLEITKATLTATADARTKVYGAANPELTFKYNGWKNDENETVLDVQPTASTTVGVTTAAGTYPGAITLSGGSDNNYMFNYVPGALEVTKAPLTVTADTQTKVYGAANPELTFKYNGWVNGEETIDTPPTIGTTADATAAAGIHPGAITLSGGSDNNYEFAFVPANLEITKATLTATADARTKVYGAANPELTFKYSGWVNGEEPIDIPPTIGTTADATAAVGTYPGAITLSGGSDNNYMFNYVPGALEVTKAPLTVTADTQTKVYGAANPELTFKYNGWVNGEDDSVLDTKPIASTTVNATSVVGNYVGAITLGDGSDNNYSFSYIAGNFDVVAPKIAGDTNGNSKIDGSEIAGDINGNGRIDGNEVPGDTSGNGMIDGTETAIDNTLPGALSADQDVISGAKPDLIISLAPGTGDGVITYTWESSVDNGLNWVVIPNETGLSYAPKTLTHTTWFRRVTTSTIKSLVFNAVTLPVRISVRPVETNDPDSPRGLIVYAIRNNEIKVKGKVSGDAVAALYDIRGNVIIVMNLEEGNLNTIPTPYIKTGIYLLKVKDRQRWQTFKVPVRE